MPDVFISTTRQLPPAPPHSTSTVVSSMLFFSCFFLLCSFPRLSDHLCMLNLGDPIASMFINFKPISGQSFISIFKVAAFGSLTDTSDMCKMHLRLLLCHLFNYPSKCFFTQARNFRSVCISSFLSSQYLSSRSYRSFLNNSSCITAPPFDSPWVLL